MYAVVKEHLRDLDGWKLFAKQTGLDLSKPFVVKEDYSRYVYESWSLPASAITLVSTPLDKSLEDYL
jgi:hypothetical protein